jgi:hypothetical protein
MTPIFTGIIRQGKEVFDQPSKYIVHKAKMEGKRFELVLRLQKSQRSLNQNAYYWSVCLEILSGHTGFTPEEIHEIMKYKFLKEHKNAGEKLFLYVKSTTKLNTTEMEEYLEKIRRFASIELNCFIPLPNECES